MESKSNTFINSEDYEKTRIKIEHFNEEEVPTVSQKQPILQNMTYFVDCHQNSYVDTKIEIKQEIWNANVTSADIQCGIEEPFTFLGPGSIRDEEIDIKEEPCWSDGISTDLHNEEKESSSEKSEVSNDMLPLESTRLHAEVVCADVNCVTSLDVHKDGASHKNATHGTFMRQNISSPNCIATCDSDYFESDHKMDEESKQLYKCAICGKNYVNKTSLRAHILLHSGTTLYKCDKCQKCFTRNADLKRHQLLHSGTKPYKCDICEKCFIQKSSLQRHSVIHLKTIPYKCVLCERCFTEKSALERHTSLHSGKKPYKCTLCEKGFTMKFALERHKLLHSGTKPHKCDMCAKFFTRKSDLSRHMLLHAGTKPFKCDICEKCFSQKSNLQTHILLHSKSTSYKCAACKKCFTRNSDLQEHKLLHSDCTPYECVECHKCFTRKSSLRRHILQHSTTKTCI